MCVWWTEKGCSRGVWPCSDRDVWWDCIIELKGREFTKPLVGLMDRSFEITPRAGVPVPAWYVCLFICSVLTLFLCPRWHWHQSSWTMFSDLRPWNYSVDDNLPSFSWWRWSFLIFTRASTGSPVDQAGRLLRSKDETSSVLQRLLNQSRGGESRARLSPVCVNMQGQLQI